MEKFVFIQSIVWFLCSITTASRETAKQSNSWASRNIIAQLSRQLTLNKMEALSDSYINTLWNEFVQVISRGRDVFSFDINNIVLVNNRRTERTKIIIC
jgi:hypothetical protein